MTGATVILRALDRVRERALGVRDVSARLIDKLTFHTTYVDSMDSAQLRTTVRVTQPATTRARTSNINHDHRSCDRSQMFDEEPHDNKATPGSHTLCLPDLYVPVPGR